MNLQTAVAIAVADDLWLAWSASGALIGDVCLPRPGVRATADGRGPGDDEDDDDDDDDEDDDDRSGGNIDPDDDEGYDDEDDDDDDEEPLQVKPK